MTIHTYGIYDVRPGDEQHHGSGQHLPEQSDLFAQPRGALRQRGRERRDGERGRAHTGAGSSDGNMAVAVHIVISCLMVRCSSA